MVACRDLQKLTLIEDDTQDFVSGRYTRFDIPMTGHDFKPLLYADEAVVPEASHSPSSRVPLIRPRLRSYASSCVAFWPCTRRRKNAPHRCSATSRIRFHSGLIPPLHDRAMKASAAQQGALSARILARTPVRRIARFQIEHV